LSGSLAPLIGGWLADVEVVSVDVGDGVVVAVA